MTEWRAFDSVEPIGAWRTDYGFGMLCALLANINRKKGAPPFKAMDFMPFMPDNGNEGGGEDSAYLLLKALADAGTVMK
jgi:hypothetical protein